MGGGAGKLNSWIAVKAQPSSDASLEECQPSDSSLVQWGAIMVIGQRAWVLGGLCAGAMAACKQAGAQKSRHRKRR